MKRSAQHFHPRPPSQLPSPASRLIVTGHRCWLTLLPLFLAAGLLPLHGQITVEVVEKADSAGASVDPLSEVNPAAVRGGNVAFSATAREGIRYRKVIRLNEVVAVRGEGSDFSQPPGDPAPGTASRFAGFDYKMVFVNAGGQIAFKANTTDNSNFGLWAGTPGAPQLVARHGSPAPGTNSSFSIGSPGNTSGTLSAWNDAGNVVLMAGIEGAPSGTTAGRWVGPVGALQPVAREGSQVAGLPNGIRWTYLGDTLRGDFAPNLSFCEQGFSEITSSSRLTPSNFRQSLALPAVYPNQLLF